MAPARLPGGRDGARPPSRLTSHMTNSPDDDRHDRWTQKHVIACFWVHPPAAAPPADGSPASSATRATRAASPDTPILSSGPAQLGRPPTRRHPVRRREPERRDDGLSPASLESHATASICSPMLASNHDQENQARSKIKISELMICEPIDHLRYPEIKKTSPIPRSHPAGYRGCERRPPHRRRSSQLSRPDHQAGGQQPATAQPP
jgi:hypothetical protein